MQPRLNDSSIRERQKSQEGKYKEEKVVPKRELLL